MAKILTKILLPVFGLTLFIAMIAWGGWIALRGDTGVGVIKRAEGPARVAPLDPSGLIVEYKGLSINQVQENGTVAPNPERVILAPYGYGLNADDLVLPESESEPEPSPAPELKTESDTELNTESDTELNTELNTESEAEQ